MRAALSPKPMMTTTTIASHPRMMSMRGVRIGLAIAVAVSAWYGAVFLLQEEILGVLMFTGPGALFGLGAGWLGHVFCPERFTWSTGLRSAIAGCVLLPPLLAALIAFGAMVDPQLLSLLFALGAWAALGAGLLVAVVLRVGWGAARRRR